MKFWIFFFIQTSILSAVAIAQPFHIHMDKPFYIVGETIHYQIYPDAHWVSDSMLVYVEFYNNSGILKAQHIHRLEGKSTGGQLELPISLNEGMYQFIVYSIWDDLLADSMIVKSQNRMIAIYNDIENKPESFQDISDGKLKDVAPSATAFHARQRTNNTVSLSLNQSNPGMIQGEFSISILRDDYNVKMNQNPGPPEEDPEINLERFKPRKQLVLYGKVTDPLTHKPVTDKNLSLYIPSIKYFKRIQANQGRIKTILPDLSENFEIQILSMNPNSRYPLLLDFSTSNLPTNRIKHTKSIPERSPTVLYLLTQYAKSRLVEDMFWVKPAEVTERKDSMIGFNPDRRFVLSKFQELSTLEDFIKEVILDAHITTIINKKKSLRLRSKDNKQLYRWPAWYMLDDIFQADEAAMLNFEIAKIKSIELYHKDLSIESQFDPLMKYSGVFSITTYLGEENKSLVYKLQGLSKDLNRLLGSIDPAHPDLRSNLSWQYKLVPNSEGILNINFQTSDLKGVYDIDVHGVNGSGDSITAHFSVIVE